MGRDGWRATGGSQGNLSGQAARAVAGPEEWASRSGEGATNQGAGAQADEGGGASGVGGILVLSSLARAGRRRGRSETEGEPLCGKCRRLFTTYYK